MIQASIENLNTVCDDINVQDEEVTFDFEGILELADNDFTISSLSDIEKARKALVDLYRKNGEEVVSEPPKQEPPLPKIINQTSQSEFLMTIDIDLIIDFCCYDQKRIANLIRQLSMIPDDGTLVILSELPFTSLSFVALFEGLSVFNLLANCKFRKVYHMDSSTGITDLMIAMRCDKVVVGEYGLISIIKADNSERFGGYVKDTYNYVVNSIYDYWIDKGLFTREEIDGLFENEADNSIYLAADEIKKRLTGSAPE